MIRRSTRLSRHSLFPMIIGSGLLLTFCGLVSLAFAAGSPPAASGAAVGQGAPTAAKATGTVPGGAFDLEPGTRVLAPIVYKQLAVLPVVKSRADPSAPKVKYLSLAEGLKTQQVTVTEHRQGATVNQVTVRNRSQLPLLLVGGEVILGGQQDRVISKDSVVPANEEAAVQVFCVEHGRWSGRREFTGAGGLAHGKLRLRAKYDGDQGKVWAEVAEKNAKLGAESSTGTYRKLAAGAEGERAVRPYREQLVAALDRLPEKNQVVGLVAAVNGRVVSVEVFATPELFRVYRQRLLDAVVMGAVDVPLAGNVEQAPTAAKVREFISKAEAAPAKEVVRSKSGRTVQKQATDVVNSTVETPVAAGQAPALIYKSYQATE